MGLGVPPIRLFIFNGSPRVILVEKPFPGRDDLYAGTEFRLVVPRHDRAIVNDMEIDLCPVGIGSVLRGQTLPEGTDPSRP